MCFGIRSFLVLRRLEGGDEGESEELGSRIVFIGRNLGGETPGAFQRSLDAALSEG